MAVGLIVEDKQLQIKFWSKTLDQDFLTEDEVLMG